MVPLLRRGRTLDSPFPRGYKNWPGRPDLESSFILSDSVFSLEPPRPLHSTLVQYRVYGDCPRMVLNLIKELTYKEVNNI